MGAMPQRISSKFVILKKIGLDFTGYPSNHFSGCIENLENENSPAQAGFEPRILEQFVYKIQKRRHSDNKQPVNVCKISAVINACQVWLDRRDIVWGGEIFSSDLCSSTYAIAAQKIHTRMVSIINQAYYKSENLQYNTLVRWDE